MFAALETQRAALADRVAFREAYALFVAVHDSLREERGGPEKIKFVSASMQLLRQVGSGRTTTLAPPARARAASTSRTPTSPPRCPLPRRPRSLPTPTGA